MLTAFKNFTSTLSASSEFEAKVSNRIFSIACVSVASYELMPQLLKQIRQHAPNISLEVHPLFTEDYESDLRLQRYDLIIDMAPRGWTTLKVEPIFSERLMVVCGALEMLPVIHGSEYIGMLPESTINAFAGTYNIKAVSLPFEHDIYDLCAIWHPSRSSESAHQWLRNQLKLSLPH